MSRFSLKIKRIPSTLYVPRSYGDLKEAGFDSCQVTPQVTPEQCQAHLYFMEKLRWERQRITDFAEQRGFSERLVLLYYTNAARDRFVTWMRESVRRDVSNYVPPMDVVLVWYSLMQDPNEWAIITKKTGTKLVSWQWKVMTNIMRGYTESSYWPIPTQSVKFIIGLLGDSDLLAKMEVEYPQVLDPADDGTNKCEYFTPSLIFPMTGFDGRQHMISCNVYAAVRRQLEYAREVLRYSWHRMPSSGKHGGKIFQGAIDRYTMYMGLVSSWLAVKRISPFDGEHSFLWPAQDIELVWKTNILNFREYQAYAVALRWVRPLPEVPGIRTVKERELTAHVFEFAYKRKYAVCLCWCCTSRRAGVDDLIFETPVNLMSKMQKAATRAHENRKRVANIDIEIDFGQSRCIRRHIKNSTKAHLRLLGLSEETIHGGPATDMKSFLHRRLSIVQVHAPLRLPRGPKTKLLRAFSVNEEDTDGSEVGENLLNMSEDDGFASCLTWSSSTPPYVVPAAAREPLEDPSLFTEQAKAAAQEWHNKVLPIPAKHWSRQASPVAVDSEAGPSDWRDREQAEAVDAEAGASSWRSTPFEEIEGSWRILGEFPYTGKGKAPIYPIAQVKSPAETGSTASLSF